MAELTDKFGVAGRTARPQVRGVDWSIGLEDGQHQPIQLTRSERFFGWLGSKLKPLFGFLPFSAWCRVNRWYDYNGYYRFKPGDVVSVYQEDKVLGFEHATNWRVLEYGRGEHTALDAYVIDAGTGVENHFKANIESVFKRVRLNAS